jgi:predicted permease
MLSDLRFALRQLVKAGAFTATVVLTFALGIGACTAIFSVVEGVLLRPLDYREPERIVLLTMTSLIGRADELISAPNYIEWKKKMQSLETMAACRRVAFNLTGSEEPQHLAGRRVTARFFETYGVKPILGRVFTPEEDSAGKPGVVVLSHALWQRVFGGTPDILGRSLVLNEEPYTVVGVAPPGFQPDADGRNADLFAPMAWQTDQIDDSKNNRAYGVYWVVGRLKPGITAAQADAELKVLAADTARRYPNMLGGWSASLSPLLDFVVRDMRRPLYVLLAAVGCVLLIACANVANLMLARATARQREITIRAALGASRGQVMRQLLTESVLLASMGGALGVLFAWWGLDGLLALAPGSLPRADTIHLNPAVLASSIALTLVTGMSVGLAPAWFAAGTNVNEALKQGARGATEDRTRGRVRKALVIAEIAAALVLLASAGLLVRSFINLARTSPGFTPEHVTLMRVSWLGKKYLDSAQKLRFAEALLSRLGALPGVQAAALGNNLPLLEGNRIGLQLEGTPYPKNDEEVPGVFNHLVTPGYFAAMGIPLVRGRLFTDQDDPRSPRVALINQTIAQQLFPNQDPIGKRINITVGPGQDAVWREIIGVVGDTKQLNALERPTNQTYEPFAQSPPRNAYIVVRTDGRASGIPAAIRGAVHGVDKDQPTEAPKLLEDVVARNIAGQRFAMTLLAAFSLIALVLASVGIFGLIAYTVSQRTAEIGIRMALGASQTDVLRQVLRQGMKLVGLGLAIGLAVALALGRLIEAQLFQTSPYDPVTLLLAPLLLAGVGFIACLVPARHATKVDPIIALRAE